MKIEKEHILDLTSELDEYCLNVVRLLLLGFKRFRFNELYRTLNESGVKLSKPTLSDHLRHLITKKLVLRKIEGIQNVTYMFNYDKFKDLAEATKEQTQPDELESEQKRFNSLSLDEQVTQILYGTIAISLHGLRLRLLNTIEPKKELIRNLELMMNSRTYDLYERWLLEECSKNKEYAQKVLEKITSYEEEFMKKRYGSLVRSSEIPDSAIKF